MAINYRMFGMMHKFKPPGIHFVELDLTPEQVKEQKRMYREKKLNRVFKWQEVSKDIEK